MEKKDLEYYKKVLGEELIELNKQLSSVSQRNNDVKGDWIPIPQNKGEKTISDESDMIHREEEFINNQAITDQLEVRYTNVSDALKRIKSNTYGVCVHGNHKIEKKRLMANSAAKTCLLHKNKES